MVSSTDTQPIDAQPELPREVPQGDAENSIVCYCYRVTTGQLKEAYKRLGSLKAVEAETRAGTGCTGCKVILHSLFGEAPSDQYNLDTAPVIGTLCAKPGHRIMKGFVIADGKLESTIYASNAVAPQLGNCDTTTQVDYALVDHRGTPVVHGIKTLRTNETFVFDTRKENFPRPFYGMFFFGLGRSNFGAARFNIYWSNGKSVTSTHENASTGRPRVFLPIIVDERFLRGVNTIYIALMNPHEATVPFTLNVYDVETGKDMQWKSELPKFCTTWINANEYLFGPALQKNSAGRYALAITATTMDIHQAITAYFFVHNKTEDLWTCNHL